MGEVKNKPLFWTICGFNILSCWICGAYILYTKPRYSSFLSWAFVFICYGSMPIFGGGDTYAGFGDNFYFDGLSAFFSLLSVIFVLSASGIDVDIIPFNNTHKITLSATVILVGILCLVEPLESVRNVIYPLGALPLIIITGYFIYKRTKYPHMIISKAPITWLCMGLLFEILGFASVVDLFGNTFAPYGWYLFCWLGVLCVFMCWYTMRDLTLQHEHVERLGSQHNDHPISP